jgi:hypothetical protein
MIPDQILTQNRGIRIRALDTMPDWSDSQELFRLHTSRMTDTRSVRRAGGLRSNARGVVHQTTEGFPTSQLPCRLTGSNLVVDPSPGPLKLTTRSQGPRRLSL